MLADAFLEAIPHKTRRPGLCAGFMRDLLKQPKNHSKSKRDQLTRVAIGVIDSSNLVDAAVQAMTTQYRTLEQLREKMQAAEDPDLSPVRRSEIQTQLTELRSQLDINVELTRFEGHRLLTHDIHSAFVPLPNSQQGVNITFTEATVKGLDLEDLDSSTHETAEQGVKKICKALASLSTGSELLVQATAELKAVAAALEAELSQLSKAPDDGKVQNEQAYPYLAQFRSFLKD